jgi:DNA replication protein DnaC
MLTQEQFDRMKDGWGFSFIHLMLEWEDLNEVPEEAKKLILDFSNDFTMDLKARWLAFKSGKKPGLYLYSPKNGNGKTSLVHMLAKELVMANKHIRKMRYISGLEIFNELKRTFSNSGISESEVLDSMTECDILIIDDIDKIGTPSEYEKKRLSLILDKRYTSLRPVILTANKSIQDMAVGGQLEPHIFSRFSQMCLEYSLQNPNDFRMKGTMLKPRKSFV